MSFEFIPNLHFAQSEEARAVVQPIGEQVIEIAKQDAPYLTGHLEESVVGEWVEEGGKQKFRITATDFKASWQEFGTVNMAAQPFLGPAAMQIVGNLQ